MGSPTIKPVTVDGKTKYRFVVDIGRDPMTGKRRQLTRTYDLRREAQGELAKILNETNKGSYATPTKVTVNDYLDEWIRSATRGKEANTQANYLYALLPVREVFGSKQLQKLTTVDVENLVDYMLTSGRKRGGKPGTALSPRSVQLTLSRLRSALDAAVHRRLIEFNVAAPVKCPAQTKVKRQPWSPAEVKTFLASLSNDRLQAPMLLALMGLRPAETCGLRWNEEIDLEAETIKVENTRTIVWEPGGGRVDEKGTKSTSGERTLPIPPPVVSALRRFKVIQARERLNAGEAYENSGYVLVDELGRPFKTDQLRRVTYKLMTAAGVRKVRPYDARHACLTYLATNGVPDVIVSAWAGHADLSFAKRVYIHPSPQDLEQGRDKLTELFG
ncbi:MAG: tyrosine-type recombinase/integrase [Candidatus Dormibacteria bacterium]